jgi:putative transposase
LIFSRLKRLVVLNVNQWRASIVHWTEPLTSSLPIGTLADLGRSKSELIAENALLREQLIMLKRQVKRPVCTKADRILLVLLARVVRAWKQALLIVQPETLLRWHRDAFRLYWKHKSKSHSHKPKVATETIALIREMATKNRLWGAERIRGELRKLGIPVCKRTIQKYMRHVRPSPAGGQRWATFFTHSRRRYLGLRCFADNGPLLSTTLCVLYYRTEIAASDPCRRDKISYRCLGGATTARSDAVWTSTRVSAS